jgi:Holliday junction DNA helicase RuvA
MIRLVRGTVVARAKDSLVLEVGNATGEALFGIGLKIFVPQPTLAQVSTGAALVLHTYLQVREDALTLFGFETEDELQVFELLIGVSGVGPKVALSVLSTLTPDALRLALINEEPAVVERVPGIGKRTAQKIVLELQGKVQRPAGALEALAQATEADSEVVDALVALGYSVVEAQRAIQTLPKDVTGVEERLRLALSQFQ